LEERGCNFSETIRYNHMNREQLIEELRKRYPKATFRTSEEFSKDMKGGIWTSAEDTREQIKGLPLFDYYSQDGGSKSYTLGVRTYLHDWLEENGWYCEFYDAGTVMIWEN